MQMRLSFSKLALCAGLALAMNASAEDTVKIALAGPTTGPLTQYGDMQNIGGLMAIEQINAKGGINGKQIEGIIMDDACEPKQAVAVANQIINDDIDFVLGHLCSSSTLPAAELYDEEGILMITAASTSPEISEKGFKYIFRTIGLDSQQAPVAADFIINKIKPKKVAVLHDKQQYGQGLAEAVNKVLTDSGVEVAIFEGVSKGQQDFSALITKMKSSGVDFVYYGGYHPELGLILRQSAEQGFDVEFLGPEGVGNPDISAIAGDASNKLYVTMPADFAALDKNKDLVEAFKAKGDDYTGPFVMPAYSAIQIISDTANKLGTEDTAAIVEEMRKASYDTPIGTVEFQDNGDLKEFAFIVYKWHADGSKTEVK